MQIVKTQKILYNQELRIRLITREEVADFASLAVKIQDSKWSDQLNSWHIPDIPDHLQYLNTVFPAGIFFYDISKADKIPGVIEDLPKKTAVLRPEETGNFISLYFPPDPELSEFMQNAGGILISDHDNCWKINYSADIMDRLTIFLKKAHYQINYPGFETGSGSELKIQNDLSSETKKFASFLETSGYGSRTVEQYVYNTRQFLKSTGPLPENIKSRVSIYIEDLLLNSNYSNSYLNQVINSLKAYLKFKRPQKNNPLHFKRPRRKNKIPVVLSRAEISRMLRMIPNLKHNVLLSTIYMTGMKVSEAVCIKTSDIDKERMLFKIRDRNGGYSRTVPLSPELLKKIEEYEECYQPSGYFFEGSKGNQYSKRSIQKAVKKYVQKAGIEKKTSVQTLRHTYAGHMAEQGLDFRLLKEYLGYSSYRSTEIYRTHAGV